MPRRSSRQPTQLALAARGRRGGYRKNAGRKRKRDGTHLGHRPRPALAARFPVHVTLKVLPGIPSLRRADSWAVLRRAFAAGSARSGFRLVHFTVQSNHMHLVCEGRDASTLGRGVQGLAIRIARNLNARLGRSGRLFAQRYHARILRSPTEVRRVLAYVLNNARRHEDRRDELARDWLDPRSSAVYFDGWRRGPPPATHDPPVAPPKTWLLAAGWRRLGLIATDEVPGPV